MLAELEKTHPARRHSLRQGYERFLSGDYPAAVAKLKPPKRACRSRVLLLAEGAQKSIEGHQERPRPHFVIRFPPEDAVIADYALDALETAASAFADRPGLCPESARFQWTSCAAPLIWLWSRRSASTRWSALAPLPVSKWGRIMLSTPRAMRLGYAWLDSLSHELVHYAVASVTHDRTPVWLQKAWPSSSNTAGAIRPAWRSRRRCNTCCQGLATHKLISFDAMHRPWPNCRVPRRVAGLRRVTLPSPCFSPAAACRPCAMCFP